MLVGMITSLLQMHLKMKKAVDLFMYIHWWAAGTKLSEKSKINILWQQSNRATVMNNQNIKNGIVRIEISLTRGKFRGMINCSLNLEVDESNSQLNIR